jgi:PAS domain S-box-containing protein
MSLKPATFGLRARVVVLALAAALPAIAAVVYYAVSEYRQASADAEVQLLRLADVVVRRQQAMVDETRSVLSLLSRNPEIGPDDPDRCTGFLDRLVDSGVINTQTLTVVSVADLQGDLYCGTATGAGSVNVADRAYFQEVLQSRQLTFGAALTGRASGQPTVPAAYPVLDAVNNVTAVLITGLNLPEIARTALPALREDAVVMLVTGDGLILGRHPDPEGWVGQTLTDEPIVAGLGEARTSVGQHLGLDGVERIYAIERTQIGNAVVYAAVGFATEQVYAAARNTLIVGLVIALVAAVAAGLLGWALGHRLVSRSVRSLAGAAERISGGDLTVRVPVSARAGELGTLAEGFNAMAAALGEREAALRDSEQRYREVVDLIPAGVWIHTGGQIVFVNAHAITMFGASAASDLVGREILSLLHPDDLPRARERTRALVHEHVLLQPQEMRFVRLDGRTIVVEAQAIRYLRDGKPYVLSAGRDVTAQRTAEEQLRQSQKMEGIGRLTGGVAHDFNNLLTVIIGNLDMALESAPIEPRRALQSALHAAEKGATLTQRLLAFSRQQALNPEPVDLNRLVAGMEEMLRRTLGEDVDITMQLRPDLWPGLVDRGQLENALLNLVVNARDAMPDGGKLTIETGNVHLDESYAAMNSEVVPGAYTMLAVTDTGVGMPPEVVRRATEPFFTTKETGKGTGLGLSMIFGFVKQSHGHMKIYSEVGIGTSVRLYLPRVATGEADAPESGPAAGARHGNGETILVVEDEADLRALVLHQLADLGYRVLEAQDGAAAREILRSELRIDLLFTDVVMPGGVNGRKLAEEALRHRPELRILYTSGYSESAIVHHGRLDPGVHLLSKPFKKQDLARKIRELLDTPPAPGG